MLFMRWGAPSWHAMLRRLITARSLRVAAASATASAAGTLAYTSCDASSWSPASYPLALAPPVVVSKPGRLQGRSAIVTGAASGMGAASAKLFAAEGAKVAVVDVNGEGAEKVAADIRAAGGDAIGVACDLTDEAQVKAAVKFIEGTYGPCNALFNHAGGLVVKDFLKISLKEWYGLSTPQPLLTALKRRPLPAARSSATHARPPARSGQERHLNVPDDA